MPRPRMLALALLLPMAALVPVAPAAAGPIAAAAGHLVFVTADGTLDIVAVKADGTTTSPVQLAPVTKVAAPKTVTVTDVVVSANRNWLAWTEQIFKPSKKYGKLETGTVLAVRNMFSGKTVTLRSAAFPLGFSGSRLVVEGARTARLVMTPTPHLVRVDEGNAYPVATYAKGVVDVKSVGPLTDNVEHEQLRLTTFGGRHTVLHEYTVGLAYRDAAANTDAVSPDGKHLLVERGNHQDFDGLGPSSLFDEYSMGPGHVRKQLGHYGTNKAKWRMVNATFVGAGDTPFVALHSGYTKTSSGHAVRGVVVSYQAGHWVLVQSGAIAVAGNAGYVVIQPGKWQEIKNSPDGEFESIPTAPAILRGPGGTHPLSGVEGSELLWAGP